MRILFLAPYFYPATEFGGPIFQNLYLCRGLVRKGHDVTVFTSTAKNQREKIYKKTTKKEIDGIKITYFRTWFSKRLYQFIAPDMIKELKKNIKNFDVVHLSEYRTFQNVALFLMKSNLPYVVACRGSFPKELGNRYLKSLFDMSVGNRILSGAEKIIVSSESERKHFEHFPELLKRTVEVPNFIPKEEVPDVKKNSFRKKYGIGKAKLILYLGRIHKMKGLDILISAFAKMSFENCYLAIVGPDSEDYGKYLKNLAEKEGIRDKITFTGMLKKKEKFEAISDCDLFVLPSTSEHESFGNVVLEALGFGKPVIVSDKCGVADYLKKSGVGAVFKSGDSKTLRIAMKRYITEKWDVKNYKNKVRVFLKNQFDENKIISMYENIYSQSVV